MRKLPAAMIAITLSGCSLAQQAQMQTQYDQSAAILRSELSECERKYPKIVKGQAAASLRCSNAAYERNARSVPGHNSDLVILAGAKAVAAGEKFDRGEISKTQLDVELASIQAEFAAGSQGRAQQGMAAAAAMEQAAAARQQAAIQQMATGVAIMSGGYSRPAPAISLPRQTDCSTYGNRTNCTTW